MSPALSPALRLRLVAKQASTRHACKKADAADAKRAEEKKEAAFRAHVAAATATDDECRSTEAFTSVQVAHLRRQLEVAERAEAKVHAARQKSKQAKADADRQALKRHRAASVPPPQILESSFTYEALQFDFAFMSVAVNVLAHHCQHTFLVADAKAVGSSGRSLLTHMENFPTETLALILTNESASFMPSTTNAACSLLFTLRTAYSHATSASTWTATLVHRDSSNPRHGSATKRTSRSLEYKRHDSSSGASFPRGSSSSGQKFRRLTKGPVKYEKKPRSKDDKDGDTDGAVERLETPRQVVPSLIDVSSGGRLQQLLGSATVPDDGSLPLSSTTAHARQATVTAAAAERDAAHIAVVKRACANTKVHKIERVTTMPFHTAIDKMDAAHQLARSIKLALSDILVRCDDQCLTGWKHPPGSPGGSFRFEYAPRKPQRPTNLQPSTSLTPSTIFSYSGAQNVGQAANARTVFQPQQGVPPAPSSGTQAPGMRYGSVLSSNPNGRQPGILRTS